MPRPQEVLSSLKDRFFHLIADNTATFQLVNEKDKKVVDVYKLPESMINDIHMPQRVVLLRPDDLLRSYEVIVMAIDYSGRFLKIMYSFLDKNLLKKSFEGWIDKRFIVEK